MDKFIWPEPQIQSAFSIATAGYPFIIATAFTTLIFALLGIKSLAIFGLLLTFFVCFFFRDPDRLIPKDEHVIVSPADGRILCANIEEKNPYIEGSCYKISIFMSVFNVHVNRIPYSGTVTSIHYFPGKFFNASFDKASIDNEKNAIIIETSDGKKMAVVQIAGLIARRILCKLQQSDSVIRGQRFGMICFGSRLDVYLPLFTKIHVSPGDKVNAGTSILGYYK
ncbi:MAG: phosphatidylserine decarboxylase family protein [Desulfobacterales bacterium]|nr:phosphatidylserine decarboxylase family protein [Desulfobacterales bacterium]